MKHRVHVDLAADDREKEIARLLELGATPKPDPAGRGHQVRRSGGPVRWSYVSPPPLHLVPGPKTGTYRAEARDTPIVDEHGESRISVGDYAAAIVDALEDGSFLRERFTVAY